MKSYEFVLHCTIVGEARPTTSYHVVFGQNRTLECSWCSRSVAIVSDRTDLFLFHCFGQFLSSRSHISVSLSFLSALHKSFLFEIYSIVCSAVCGRIEPSIQSRLPLYYTLNKPKFALVTSTDARNEIKAPKFGINWTINDRIIEVIDSSTGRTVYNRVSRLAKQKFFSRYANLIKQLPNLRNERTVTGDYSGTKQNAHDYQIAKRELVATLYRQNLGSWVKKPIELDKFSLLAHQPNRMCFELKQCTSSSPSSYSGFSWLMSCHSILSRDESRVKIKKKETQRRISNYVCGFGLRERKTFLLFQ